jgi:hypothetical protein
LLTAKFLKRGDPFFLKAALKHFQFLETEYQLEINGVAEAYETVIIYENETVKLQIVFSLPEAPFIVFQQKENNKIKKEIRYKPSGRETINLIKEYNNYRDSCAFEVWHKKLRKGDFTQLIEDILDNLSSELKINPNLLQKSFEV